MRVLLVEDDLSAARGIVAMLKASAMVVDAVDTGEEALELRRGRRTRNETSLASDRGIRSCNLQGTARLRHGGCVSRLRRKGRTPERRL